MKQVIKEFAFEFFRQTIGWKQPREGVIIPTPYTWQRMRAYGVDIATLEDVFQYGERKRHKIVQRYTNATVGLYYKTLKRKGMQPEKRYVITTCWKKKK